MCLCKFRDHVAVHSKCASAVYDGYAESLITYSCLAHGTAQGLLCVCGVQQENVAEIKQVWNMFKEDPLSPVGAYWRNFGMPGIGLFLEGYVVSDCQQCCFHARHSACAWLDCVSAYELHYGSLGACMTEKQCSCAWLHCVRI